MFKTKPWITPALQKPISIKNNLLKKFIAAKYPQVKERYNKEYKYYNYYFETNLNSIKNTWKGLKSRVRLIFWKRRRENLSIYPFVTLCWVNEDENRYPDKFSQPYRTLYIAQLPKTNLLSETIVLSGPTGIYLFEFFSNNNSIMCKICSKLTIEVPNIFEYIYFLMTLNMEYFIALI